MTFPTNNPDLLKRAIDAVSIRQIIAKFGRSADVPERDKVKFCSILRPDRNPSCSIEDGKYHDWSRELHLDSYSVFQELSGLDQKKAFVPFVEMSPYAHELNGQRNGATPFDWMALARNVSDENLKELSDWRGYSVEFCRWLVDLGYIGRKGSNWAFPVFNNGRVVAAHIRQDKDVWRYEPKLSEFGLRVTPFVIGDIATAQRVVVAESQWDTFSVLDELRAHNGERAAGVSTRGAANGKLVIGIGDAAAEIILVPQNDPAGEGWLDTAKANLKQPFKIVRVPKDYHDANDWHRDCGDIAGAIEEAPIEQLGEVTRPNDSMSEHSETEKDCLEWLRPKPVSVLTSEAPEQILRGVLYKGCKGILTGGSKSYKTWTLMDIAYCVGNGLLWWGTHTLQCPVAYLDFEHIDYDFRWRMEQIAAAHGTGSIDAVKRIGLRSRRLTAAHWAEIYKQVLDSGSGLVLADPTYKLLPPRGDENAAGDIAEVTHIFDLLSEQTGAAVIYAQHYSKGNQAQKESIDRAAGSGVWARDADAIICMTKHDAGDDCLTIEMTLRSFPRIEPFVVRWNLPLFERAPDLDPADLKQSSKPGGSTAKYSVDDLVKILGVKDLKTEAFKKLVQNETGMSHGKFYELLKVGQAQGRLHKSQTDDKWEVVRK
jgi:AAA domain